MSGELERIEVWDDEYREVVQAISDYEDCHPKGALCFLDPSRPIQDVLTAFQRGYVGKHRDEPTPAPPVRPVDGGNP